MKEKKHAWNSNSMQQYIILEKKKKFINTFFFSTWQTKNIINIPMNRGSKCGYRVLFLRHFILYGIILQYLGESCQNEAHHDNLLLRISKVDRNHIKTSKLKCSGHLYV